MKYVIYIPKKNIIEVFDMSVRADKYNMYEFMLDNYEGNDTFKIYRAVKELEPVFWVARSFRGQVMDIDLTDRYGYVYDSVSIRDGH